METKKGDRDCSCGRKCLSTGDQTTMGACDVQPGTDAMKCLWALSRSYHDLLVVGGQGTRLNTLYLDSRKYFIVFLRVPLWVGWLPVDDTISWIWDYVKDPSTGSGPSKWCQRTLTSALSSSRILSITLRGYLWHANQIIESWGDAGKKTIVLDDIIRIEQDTYQIPDETE